MYFSHGFIMRFPCIQPMGNVALLATLFKSLRDDTIVGPMRLFAESSGDSDVAFKAAKLSETVLAGQFSVLVHEIEGQSASIYEAAFEDLGSNADMYIFDQNDLPQD